MYWFKQIFMLLFAFTFCVMTSNAQDKTTSKYKKETQDDFIIQVIQSLDESNFLRRALEQGDRGDGIHHPWMDEMKKFRIKQAAFTFNFEWKNKQVKKVVIKKISYLTVYYKFDSYIEDKSMLRKVKNSGLEETLKTEAIVRVKDLITRIMIKEKKEDTTACGTIYDNLLDDERLPILADMPDIQDCH